MKNFRDIIERLNLKVFLWLILLQQTFKTKRSKKPQKHSLLCVI